MVSAEEDKKALLKRSADSLLSNDEEAKSAATKKLKKKDKKKRKHQEDKVEATNNNMNTVEQVEKKSKKSKKDKKKSKHSKKEDEEETRQKVLNVAAEKKAVYTQNSKLSTVPQSQVDAYLKENNIQLVDNSKQEKPRPAMKFDHIDFPIDIADVFKSLKFDKPTPIQAVSWPYIFSGRDMVGIAATGSGKTYAFGIPAIAYIQKQKQLAQSQNLSKKAAHPYALIISPTRELAIQIQQTLTSFTSKLGLSCVCVFGGAPKAEQRKQLLQGKTGADIVVATPGRLMDMLGLAFGGDGTVNSNDAVINLSRVGFFILDEADRMLDMGFEKDIKKIADVMKGGKPKQTVMFSATWPQQIQALALTYMNNPIKVTIGDTNQLAANTSITQHVTVLEPQAKESKLLELLKKYHSSKKNRVLVFVLYKKEASRIEGFLKRNGWSNVKSIHGDLSQSQRIDALDTFKSGTCPLLIATDVAARGIDIPNVEYVINYTYPLTTEEYCHRIGRTGRAGKTGISHTLFTFHDKSHSGALINVLKGANQTVPDSLFQFGTTVKKKLDPNYGAFVKDVDMSKKGEKIVFADSDSD